MKITIFFLLIGFISFYAQNIESTLGTNGDYIIKDASTTFLTLKQSSGFLGVGTGVTSPRAQLEVGGLNGFLSTGTYNSGMALNPGAGDRIHWYPKKSAFRVGSAESTWWDDINIGGYSIAMGYRPRATGLHSVAIGANNRASANYSLALGCYSNATGEYSIAIGRAATAAGSNSIIIGTYATTENTDGSVIITDNSQAAITPASNNNQLTMRFDGGYRFWTSQADSFAGVYMRHHQSGWTGYCNRNLKENFEPVDGEWILGKIKSIPITKWNYKADRNKEKYIGPVAQDFYAAFHLNGTDSLGINSISMDGINLSGVQALENRTAIMQNKIDMLVNQNKQLKEQLESFVNIKEELAEIKKLKLELTEKLELLKNVTYDKEKEKNVVAVHK